MEDCLEDVEDFCFLKKNMFGGANIGIPYFIFSNGVGGNYVIRFGQFAVEF